MWHPIDTAPKNGAQILLKTADQIEVGCFFAEEGSWFSINADGQSYEIFPEQWRPLPNGARVLLWLIPLSAMLVAVGLMWFVA